MIKTIRNRTLIVTGLALSAFVLASASACTKPAGDKVRSKKEKGESGPGQTSMTSANATTDNAVDEGVDVPSNISGAFLNCAVRKEGKTNDISMEIGCVLKDKLSGRKLDVEGLKWAANDSDGVDVLTQEISSTYNVLYRLRSYDLKTLVEKAEALEAIASYKDQILKREKVYNVLKPAIELEDFEAPIVREQGIKPDDDGSL